MTNCKECIREIVCKYNDGVNEYCKGNCPHFKDCTRFVELPFDIGSIVFLIEGEPHDYEIDGYLFLGCTDKYAFLTCFSPEFNNIDEHFRYAVKKFKDDMRESAYVVPLEDLYFSIEEAVKALEERNNA